MPQINTLNLSVLRTRAPTPSSILLALVTLPTLTHNALYTRDVSLILYLVVTLYTPHNSTAS